MGFQEAQSVLELDIERVLSTGLRFEAHFPFRGRVGKKHPDYMHTLRAELGIKRIPQHPLPLFVPYVIERGGNDVSTEFAPHLLQHELGFNQLQTASQGTFQLSFGYCLHYTSQWGRGSFCPPSHPWQNQTAYQFFSLRELRATA